MKVNLIKDIETEKELLSMRAVTKMRELSMEYGLKARRFSKVRDGL